MSLLFFALFIAKTIRVAEQAKLIFLEQNAFYGFVNEGNRNFAVRNKLFQVVTVTTAFHIHEA